MSENSLLNLTKAELIDLIKDTIKNEFETLLKAKNSSEPEFLNIEEASKYLNLAVNTIYEKTSLKLIPFYKRDKKLYFKKMELEEWLLKRHEKEHQPIIRKLPIPKQLKKVA